MEDSVGLSDQIIPGGVNESSIKARVRGRECLVWSG